MDSTAFNTLEALHDLKKKNLSPEDAKFVEEALEKHEKGEAINRNDVLMIKDLIEKY